MTSSFNHESDFISIFASIKYGLTKTESRSWSNKSIEGINRVGHNDKGGASRFFYCPKASKKDRDEGLDNFEEYTSGKNGRGLDRMCSECGTKMVNQKDCVCENPNWIDIPKKNHHPTVKPTALMLYLIKLVTPKGGTVLDCFLGSGSTGKAAIRGGFNFVGIEREKEYIDIAEARINNELKDKHDGLSL
jgi:site-specific DNA-methyltransferase (adenine-specific)